MVHPDPLSKATEPAGTGRSVRCIVHKDGRTFEVVAMVSRFDNKTDQLSFPAYLTDSDGFTLLAIEGEPDFESVARNVN